MALTRARTDLLLSTHLWGPGKKTLSVPSRFLLEVRDALPGPCPLRGGTPPRRLWRRTARWRRHRIRTWPSPPARPGRTIRSVIDGRRWAPSGAAAHHRRRGSGGAHGGDPRVDDLRLLLAEEAMKGVREEPVVEVPRHLSASAVVALARDPEAFALRLRRPMPEPPALAARQGTAFHAWVEEHFSRAAIVDLFDLPGSADEGPPATRTWTDAVELPRERVGRADPGGDRAVDRDGHRWHRGSGPDRRGLPTR